jgi:hypothetical protein
MCGYLEQLDQTGFPRLARDEREPAASSERIDRTRFAGIRSACEGHFSQRAVRQLMHCGDAQGESCLCE